MAVSNGMSYICGKKKKMNKLGLLYYREGIKIKFMSHLSRSFLFFLSLFSFLFLEACIPKLEKSILDAFSLLRTQSKSSSAPKIFVTVNGLSGKGLVLSLNNSFTLAISQNGEESFVEMIPSGSNYTVTVKTQPASPTQNCTVSGGEGVMGTSDVKSININCDTTKYTLGGNITGLLGFTGVTLTNNGTDTALVTNPSGTFAFPSHIYAEGSVYSVSVTTQPSHPSQTCTLTGGSGTFSTANITSLSISCGAATSYGVAVNVTGLASGTLTLNQGTESLTVSANGTHYFPSDLVNGAGYSLSISNQPALHTCALTGSVNGTIAGTNIIASVNCFSVLAQTPANLSALLPNQTVRLQFSEAVNAGSCPVTAAVMPRADAGAIQYSVTTTNIPDDTLILSPGVSTWTPGSKAVPLSCVSVGGNSLANASTSFRYTVPSAIRYVSTTGNDSNTGLTVSDPFLTVHKAIDDLVVSACFATKDCVVLVEDGTYEATDVPLAKNFILVRDGISLFGGYTAGTGFATRNTSAKLTILRNSTPNAAVCTAAVIGVNPCSTLWIDSTISNKTVIDGFRMIGATVAATADSAAMHILGGNPIVSNNSLEGGAGNAVAGLSLVNFGGSSLADPNAGAIVLNSIFGGACLPNSCNTAGIYYNNTVSTTYPILQYNQVLGGSCNTPSCITYGMYANATSSPDFTLVRFNVFSGGTVTAGTAGSLSVGLFLQQSIGGVLIGNYILGGSANTTKGLHFASNMGLNVGNNATKQGNVILGGSGVLFSYGIYLTGGGNVYYNTVSGGSVSNTAGTATGFGIYSQAGSFDMFGNTVSAGTSTADSAGFSASYAVYLSNGTSASRFQQNRVFGGVSRNLGSNNAYSVGLQIFSGATFSIHNNFVDGGTSISATGTAISEGMTLDGNNAVTQVYNNTVSSGTTSSPVPTSESVGLNLKGITNATDIQNNIFMVESLTNVRYCVKYASASSLFRFDLNVMHNCSVLFYNGNTSQSYDTICGVGYPAIAGCPANHLNGISSTGNLLQNPMFISNFGTNKNWTFTVNSPCQTTQIGTGGSTIDFYGTTRTAPNSAGALEYDGVCL
ncbi:beta strand repeat-containing protein [Leptospira ilyithenensis]|uniref:DUF1565 domain-containing protein n=1 Tax=Leptospira ilyithenensis TaxID=2484901 RepID=A0A4R9LQC3_9LEPT|nr:Ig-like domain-containing protein [Leptospira ilyithenensis]TGN09825.1 hypothetical protein EHS11_12175 [Leptospira ilyithenensis]